MIKERVLEIAESKGIPKEKFVESIGMTYGSFKGSQKKTSLNSDAIDKILTIEPDVNPMWLLTGKGEMYMGLLSENEPQRSNSSDEALEQHTVPLLPIYAQGGSLDDFTVTLAEGDYERIVSPIKDVDLAIEITGDSMYPEYPSGSRVLTKKINERTFIEWGKAYVLNTCNGYVAKVVVPSEKEGYIKCQSINPAPQFAPFDIAQQDIFGMYKILMVMTLK